MLLAGVLLVGIMQGSVFAAQEDFVGDNGMHRSREVLRQKCRMVRRSMRRQPGSRLKMLGL